MSMLFLHCDVGRHERRKHSRHINSSGVKGTMSCNKPSYYPSSGYTASHHQHGRCGNCNLFPCACRTRRAACGKCFKVECVCFVEAPPCPAPPSCTKCFQVTCVCRRMQPVPYNPYCNSNCNGDCNICDPCDPCEKVKVCRTRCGNCLMFDCCCERSPRCGDCNEYDCRCRRRDRCGDCNEYDCRCRRRDRCGDCNEYDCRCRRRDRCGDCNEYDCRCRRQRQSCDVRYTEIATFAISDAEPPAVTYSNSFLSPGLGVPTIQTSTIVVNVVAGTLSFDLKVPIGTRVIKFKINVNGVAAPVPNIIVAGTTGSLCASGETIALVNNIMSIAIPITPIEGSNVLVEIGYVV
jgi:hypothetical protein